MFVALRDLVHRVYAVVFLAVGVFALGVAGVWRPLPCWAFAWLGSALLAVGYGYLRADVRVFGKRSDGTRARWASLLLFPYLALSELVWRSATAVSREPAVTALGEGLWLARRLRAGELPDEVAHVVDLTCEFVEPALEWGPRRYSSLPMLDGVAPSLARLTAGVERVAGAECLLIHCAQGHGRTGLFAAALLLRRGQARTPEQALARIRSARPGVRLSADQRARLREYAEHLAGAAHQ